MRISDWSSDVCSSDLDGLPMTMKSGAVRIALEASVPLVPVAQWGAQEILPAYSRQLRWGWRRRVIVLVGPPVPLDDLRDLESARAIEVGRRRLEDTLSAIDRKSTRLNSRH